MAYQATSPKARFAAKYEVEGTTGCWIWMAAKKPSGYGNFMMCKVNGRGTFVNAHKASWLLHKGPIPDGLCVLHHCDNPQCVNPAHLFLGTKKDNSQDMLAKGRGGPVATGGEAHPVSKLTSVKVRQMREARARGALLAELATQFGVGEPTVWYACAGRTWKKAGGPLT